VTRTERGVRARDAARWVLWGSKVLGRGAVQLVRVARGGHLKESLRPWMRFERVDDVPFELLAGQGVKAVLFDLENTLCAPGGPYDERAHAIVERVRSAGMRAAVVTNASASWVGDVLRAQDVPHIAPAGKPGRQGFLDACRQLGVKPAHAVYVGDQMITDVMGAQRAGLRAILLEPQWKQEAFSSRFQRVVSKALLKAVGR
jgi:uncharacterized protein